MERSFIFGKNQQYRTPEELAQARAAANKLLTDQPTPTDLGSGLNAIGRALLYRSLLADAETRMAPDPGADEVAVGSPPVTKVDPVAKALNIAKAEAPRPSPKVAEALTGRPVSKTNNPNLPSRFDFERPSNLTFSRVTRAGRGWTEVQTADGQTIRRDGARNWRNNNPGNIEYGPFARRNGAVGSDGRFAVFPTLEAGRVAKESLLFEDDRYRGSTLAEAITKWAPPKENNTARYIETLAKAAGVSPDTLMSTLSPEQRAAALAAMERVEGFRVGQERVSGAVGPVNSHDKSFELPRYAPVPSPTDRRQVTASQDSFELPQSAPIPSPADRSPLAMPQEPDPARFKGGMDRAFEPTPQMLRRMLQNPLLNEAQRDQILRQIERQEGKQGIDLPSSVPAPAERHAAPQNNFADPARFVPGIEPAASQPTLPMLRQALLSPQLNETQHAQISRQIERLQGNPDVELPQSAPIPSSAIRKQRSPDLADSPPASEYGWLTYTNQRATRNQPLNGKLVDALDSFLPDLGVTMEVFSGGQDATGPNRVGSHRHDHGNAADVFFFKDGRRLDWANAEDLPVFEEIVRRGRAAGITGFGAGKGYMRQGSMHLGFGSPLVWGAGGHSATAPDWLRNAYDPQGGRGRIPVLPRSAPIPSLR